MITAQHVEAAERLLGIVYTPAERQQMIGNLDGQIALAAARRKVSLANSMPMASRFDPRLPTTPATAEQEPLRYGTDAPSPPDDEVDIAFAPITHLAAWISNGALTSPAGSTITLNNVVVGNQSIGSLAVNFGSGGLTQFASTGGTATINQINQNGFAAGQLQSIAVNNNGLVVGTFSNGQNLDMAAVSLSHFNGTNYLKALDGGAYAVTNQSGVAISGATGSISGSSLEGSNTDIADEFTKLIVTQQAYSANTKVITTANSMVQDLLNVLR